MQADGPNRWSGRVYNAQNGKTYDASITLTREDRLLIEGCVMKVFCGGETWTKVTTAEPASPANRTAPGQKPSVTKQGSALDVCSRISDVAGPSQ
jgi:hypothetical protein